MRPLPALLALLLSVSATAQVITPKAHHLRYGDAAEWDDVTTKPEGDRLALQFDAKANAREQTLWIRHRDLRHTWVLSLNGKLLARLAPETDDMRVAIAVPPGALRDGVNELTLIPQASANLRQFADDVFVGPISLVDRPRKDVLTESYFELVLWDKATPRFSGTPIPGRFTIVDEHGSRVDLGTPSSDRLAVRPGVVYTADGRAKIDVPAGRYTVYAGRGFEWGIDSHRTELAAGEGELRILRIGREVDTAGYVAADPHVHTFTHSKHGDATALERAITLAGEGIELPIATDHNLNISLEDVAKAAGVRQHFTPVVGSEVTTPKLGHFNVFPLDPAGPPIDYRLPTWDRLFAAVRQSTPTGVVILNHARDVHGGFRPFDPSRHISMTGEDLDGWNLPIDAMEVINSGATTSDPRILFRDWMGLINTGRRVAPIGSSDSHDVAKYVVGQGRTYVRGADGDPGKVDVAAATGAVKRGQVLVSYGLLADLRVGGKSVAGEIVKSVGDLDVELVVSGPSWTRASRAEVYINGELWKTIDVPADAAAKPGRKLQATLTIPRPPHDVFVTALAIGPGVTEPYWPPAKPYQPTSSRWSPYVLGITGAAYLDADGDGQFESAADISARLVKRSGSDPAQTLGRLVDQHPSVAHQAVARLLKAGVDAVAIRAAALVTPEPVRRAVTTYLDARAASRAAREAVAK
ncbi:MAG TPA: CehA/McbA family metallohydrolase [Tepidisphaeraceae bacterium]|nr:CehA/McbA family metallohydrolase [Tepidisphaeraceae bacterium]